LAAPGDFGTGGEKKGAGKKKGFGREAYTEAKREITDWC
jgi:hypothetical protein